MNLAFLRASSSALILGIMSATIVSAQGTGTTSAMAGTRVAVIDIGKVFEEHPGFKQAMESLKQEVQNVEGQMRQRRSQMETIRERMKTFQTGTPEYKEQEGEIMRIQAEGQIEATQKKKEFIEREAQVYFTVYREIVAEVGAFCRQHGIGLVLRFNSEEMDVKNPQSVLEGVNQPIVFQDRLNITTLIVEQIGRRYASNNSGAGNAASRR